MMPQDTRVSISTFGNMPNDADQADLADALPRQAEHQEVQSGTAQAERECGVIGPAS